MFMNSLVRVRPFSAPLAQKLLPAACECQLKNCLLQGESKRCLCVLAAGRVPTSCLSHHKPQELCLSPPPYALQVRHLFKLPKIPKPFQKASKRKQYTERRILGYSSEQMYTIVADVGNYKDFIPWCTASSMREGPKGWVGYMEVGFPPVIEGYNSNITLIKPTLVLSECTEGKLFSHLVTEWRFSPGLPGNPKTCTLDFHVEFEFKSQLHSKLATVFFDEVVKTMVKAFLNRAGKVYGPESIRPQKPKVIDYSS